jgi:hypothetical protein
MQREHRRRRPVTFIVKTFMEIEIYIARFRNGFRIQGVQPASGHLSAVIHHSISNLSPHSSGSSKRQNAAAGALRNRAARPRRSTM